MSEYRRPGEGEIVRLDEPGVDNWMKPRKARRDTVTDPEWIDRQVAWMMGTIDNCPPEYFARLSPEEVAVAERVKRLQAEGKIPGEKDVHALHAVFAKCVPEARYTRDDLRAYYKRLHEDVGCPGCKYGMLMKDRSSCGGITGKNPNIGCGWTCE